MIERNRHLNQMPPGAAFTSQLMAATTMMTGLYLLGNAYFGWAIDSGFLYAGNRLSNMVPVAWWCFLTLIFATAASFLRPRGIKWAFSDLIWTLFIPACLIAAVTLKRRGDTGVDSDTLSTWYIVAGLIALDATINHIWPSIKGEWGWNKIPVVAGTFEAVPNTISVGGSAELRWDIQHAIAIEIDNSIGPVVPVGTRRVAPAATTTYRMTHRGADGVPTTRTVTVTVNP